MTWMASGEGKGEESGAGVDLRGSSELEAR